MALAWDSWGSPPCVPLAPESYPLPGNVPDRNYKERLPQVGTHNHYYIHSMFEIFWFGVQGPTLLSHQRELEKVEELNEQNKQWHCNLFSLGKCQFSANGLRCCLSGPKVRISRNIQKRPQVSKWKKATCHCWRERAIGITVPAMKALVLLTPRHGTDIGERSSRCAPQSLGCSLEPPDRPLWDRSQ